MGLVKRMLVEMERNEDEYEMIDKLLGIKQNKVNHTIRAYLNENY